HGVKGDLLVVRGRHEAAIASYLEAARCDPDNPGWPYRAAGVQAGMSRWQDVVATLEPLTERAPYFAEAFYDLGRAQAMLGRQQQARTALQRAAELRPDDPRIIEALRGLSAAQTPTRALDGPVPRQ
ncbi:MAG: tetratricopeptide repeat protein, partial [Planctomycetota bacterium]